MEKYTIKFNDRWKGASAYYFFHIVEYNADKMFCLWSKKEYKDFKERLKNHNYEIPFIKCKKCGGKGGYMQRTGRYGWYNNEYDDCNLCKGMGKIPKFKWITDKY
jgi:hypothetical protein